MRRSALFIATILSMLTVAATAQESKAEISAQATGFFTKNSTGNGTTQRTTDSTGLLIGYRHRLYRWISAEANYGYTRSTQQYFQSVGVSRIQANIHEATGGFVVNVPFVRTLHPFVLAEGGALVFVPTKNTFGTVVGAQRQPAGVFVFGGGVSYPIVGDHLLLRAEYRGLTYASPYFGLRNLNPNAITYSSQPSAGLVYRF